MSTKKEYKLEDINNLMKLLKGTVTIKYDDDVKALILDDELDKLGSSIAQQMLQTMTTTVPFVTKRKSDNSKQVFIAKLEDEVILIVSIDSLILAAKEQNLLEDVKDLEKAKKEMLNEVE